MENKIYICGNILLLLFITITFVIYCYFIIIIIIIFIVIYFNRIINHMNYEFTFLLIEDEIKKDN